MFRSLFKPQYLFSNTFKFHPSQTATLKDKLILVDEQDNYLSPIQKQEAHRWEYINNGKPHRAFSVFLFDKQNRLLMQKRSQFKILFPLMWTNSCCSHPLLLSYNPLELQSQEEAIEKRVPFELGLNVKKENLRFIGKLVYKAQGLDRNWGEYEVDSIYFTRAEGEVKFNKDQVDDVEWVKLSQLDQFVKGKKQNVTPWFRQIYQGDLKRWWKQYSS